MWGRIRAFPRQSAAQTSSSREPRAESREPPHGTSTSASTAARVALPPRHRRPPMFQNSTRFSASIGTTSTPLLGFTPMSAGEFTPLTSFVIVLPRTA